MIGSSQAIPTWVFLALALPAACADVREDGGFAASVGLTEGEASGITNPGDGADDGDASGGSKFDVGDGAEGAGDDGGPLGSCDAAAEDKSSLGCAFWAVDLPNAWEHSIWNASDEANPAEQQFSVAVANASSEASAHVEVRLEGELVDSADVSFDEIHVFDLPRMDIDPATTSTDGRAFEITSDVPIAAYQFQPLDNDPPPYSNDASLLFPVHALDRDYVAVTGYSSGINLQNSPDPNVPTNIGAFVSVVAIEDDTEVDMWPTAPLSSGPEKDVVLARGQVFTVIADGGGVEGTANLSGTRVSASKPVAVFSGNVAAHEPREIAGCCLDHLEHQLMPMTAWSTRYLSSAPPNYEGKVDESYVVRMIGGQDGITLTYDPVAPVGAPVELATGQMVEFTTKQSFAVEGNLPFSLVQFLQSNQTLGYGVGNAVPGDPAMWVVPPVQQFESKYVFLSPSAYAKSFVTITNPAGVAIELDGQVVTGQYWATGQVGGTNYMHIHVPVTPGPHMIVAAEPIGISVFGYDTDVSYAYPGGSGVKYFQPPPPPPQG